MFDGLVTDDNGEQVEALGLEWDNPTKGKHNGTIAGVSYFTPRRSKGPKGCSFVPHEKVTLLEIETAGVYNIFELHKHFQPYCPF